MMSILVPISGPRKHASHVNSARLVQAASGSTCSVGMAVVAHLRHRRLGRGSGCLGMLLAEEEGHPEGGRSVAAGTASRLVLAHRRYLLHTTQGARGACEVTMRMANMADRWGVCDAMVCAMLWCAAVLWRPTAEAVRMCPEQTTARNECRDRSHPSQVPSTPAVAAGHEGAGPHDTPTSRGTTCGATIPLLAVVDDLVDDMLGVF
jgi:hypothetical protein